jgi:hypothetical protein
MPCLNGYVEEDGRGHDMGYNNTMHKTKPALRSFSIRLPHNVSVVGWAWLPAIMARVPLVIVGVRTLGK